MLGNRKKYLIINQIAQYLNPMNNLAGYGKKWGTRIGAEMPNCITYF